MQQQTERQNLPAVHWAETSTNPRLGDVEREAARDIPTLSAALEIENMQPSTGVGPSRDGFVKVIEEWLLPIVVVAGLFTSAHLVAPASWFGYSITYTTTERLELDITTLNASNVDSRLIVAMLVVLLGLILVVTTIVIRARQRYWRITTQFMSILIVVGAGVNVIFLNVNIRDGYRELSIALWGCVILAVVGLIMAVMSFAGYRRGRARQAVGLFQSLPAAQQQTLVYDRDSALDVLIQRGFAKPRDVARVKKMVFGKFTGQVNVNREE